jgi:hypothetical protein
LDCSSPLGFYKYVALALSLSQYRGLALSLFAENGEGGFEYQATQEGDLRRFLEAIRADTTLIRQIETIRLDEELDDQESSEVIEFENTYVVTTDVTTVGDDVNRSRCALIRGTDLIQAYETDTELDEDNEKEGNDNDSSDVNEDMETNMDVDREEDGEPIFPSPLSSQLTRQMSTPPRQLPTYGAPVHRSLPADRLRPTESCPRPAQARTRTRTSTLS